MNNKFIIPALLLGVAAMASCSGKLGALSADNFTVTPSPMEAHANQVPVTISGVFPEKYMKKKAVVRVTPVLTSKIDGQQVVLAQQAATFQGEKVRDNHTAINYRIGGNYTMRAAFPYTPNMRQSTLSLRFDARIGKKKVNVPEVAIAPGVIATYTLAHLTMHEGHPAYAPDAYQHVVKKRQEAHIRFLIQQAQVRTNELKTQSVQDFVKMLYEIQADQKTYQLNNVEVAAYASPDGGVKLNERLSAQREKNTTSYVQGVLKATKNNAPIDTRYTAQDWEGFRQLLQASNIQDKEVILRVLSMYEDPEQREQQIRNISAGFSELTTQILPELRRSRLAINYEVVGRTDDEIMAEINARRYNVLSIEELLYAAQNLGYDDDQRLVILEQTTRLFPTDHRATNNIAAIYLQQGRLTEAKATLAKLTNSKLPEVAVNRGRIALAEGRIDEAEALIAQGTGAAEQQEALGNVYILQGKYAQAAKALKGTNTTSEVLAQILNNEYSTAIETLSKLPETYLTQWLTAIVAKRQGNTTAAKAAFTRAKALAPQSHLPSLDIFDYEMAGLQ